MDGLHQLASAVRLEQVTRVDGPEQHALLDDWLAFRILLDGVLASGVELLGGVAFPLVVAIQLAERAELATDTAHRLGGFHALGAATEQAEHVLRCTAHLLCVASIQAARRQHDLAELAAQAVNLAHDIGDAAQSTALHRIGDGCDVQWLAVLAKDTAVVELVLRDGGGQDALEQRQQVRVYLLAEEVLDHALDVLRDLLPQAKFCISARFADHGVHGVVGELPGEQLVRPGAQVCQLLADGRLNGGGVGHGLQHEVHVEPAVSVVILGQRTNELQLLRWGEHVRKGPMPGLVDHSDVLRSRCISVGTKRDAGLASVSTVAQRELVLRASGEVRELALAGVDPAQQVKRSHALALTELSHVRLQPAK